MHLLKCGKDQWMRKFFVTVLLFGQFIGLTLGGSVRAQAKGLEVSALRQQADNVFTFNQLGYAEKIMVGPYDSARILFSLPPTWQLIEGGTITLRYTLTVSSKSVNSSNLVGGMLVVTFNNKVIDTILLDQTGEVTQVIAIPPEAFKPVAADGRHLIGLFFDASVNCDNIDINSNLIVSADSAVQFQHVFTSPVTDLSIFPRPFYQPQALVKTPATIVIPDQPSITELQAAMAVSAGLGGVTGGELQADLITENKLTQETRISHNLIFVGRPNQFPILQGIPLPVPITKDRLIVNGAKQDDGIIQVALSPWSQTNLIMLISGNTEAATLKAAKTIGTEKIVPGSRRDVAVISEVNPNISIKPIAESETLQDLGYDNFTLGDIGGLYKSFVFPVSPEQALSTGAYLDLITAHSGLLDFGHTGISVILNGEMVGSIQFDKDSEQITTTRIKLLPEILRRGNNMVEIVSELTPSHSCFSQDLNSAWVMISSSSVIHVPVTAREFNLGKSLDLKNFPSIMLSGNDLSDLAFILPKDDFLSWSQASKIAYFMGYKGSIVLPNLQAAYANDVPEKILKERNLIIFGRASSLPIISQLKDALPAPFDVVTNEAIQPTMLVNYRLLPGVSVGYIQLFPSPWNLDRSILTVMGNTDEGIPMAGNTLVLDKSVSNLKGNFAIVYGNQTLTTDTRLGPSKGGLAGELPAAVTVTPATVAPDSTQASEPDIKGRALWILPAVIAMTVIILVIAVIVVRKEFMQRVVEKEKSPDNNKE